MLKKTKMAISDGAAMARTAASERFNLRASTNRGARKGVLLGGVVEQADKVQAELDEMI